MLYRLFIGFYPRVISYWVFEMNKEAGFSLMETVVVMAIASLIMGMGFQNFGALESSVNRGDAIQKVDSTLRKAKQTAASLSGRAILSIDLTNNLCKVGIDMLPYSNNGTADRNVFSVELPKDISFHSSAKIIFDSRGYLITDSGDLTSVTNTIYDGADLISTSVIYPTGFVEY